MVDAHGSGKEEPPAGVAPSRRLGAVLEGLVEDERLEWYLMTAQERWVESQHLWATFELMGGSLEPQPDSQSPFDFPREPGPGSPDGRPGVHSVRRSGV